MTQNSWVDPRKIRENPPKETLIAMDFPHTVTVMVAIADAPFWCFGWNNPIHAMKQYVIKLMGIGYFQCKSGSITCTFGEVARNPNTVTHWC